MIERVKYWFEDVVDSCDGILLVLVIILMVLLIAGLTFGGCCFTGWILMIIYNAIRPAFNLPELSYWIFVGIAFVISLLRPSVHIKNRED